MPYVDPLIRSRGCPCAGDRQWCDADADLGTVNLTVLACPGKTWWLVSTSSIRTLCSPGGIPPMSMVLIPLDSAHNQGRSSTRMCRWPIRGETSSAAFPKTGRMRTFSVRYWTQKRPLASPLVSGSSTINLGAGSSATSTYGLAPRTSLALGTDAGSLAVCALGPSSARPDGGG